MPALGTDFQNTGLLPASAKLAVKYRSGRWNTGQAGEIPAIWQHYLWRPLSGNAQTTKKPGGFLAEPKMVSIFLFSHALGIQRTRFWRAVGAALCGGVAVRPTKPDTLRSDLHIAINDLGEWW